MTTSTSDRLYVVRLTTGGAITCIDEAKARASHASHPGSTLSYRPFPSTVKMPYIGKDYVLTVYGPGEVGATYTPLGVTGYGDEPEEAYCTMLRAIRDHLERATEVAL